MATAKITLYGMAKYMEQQEDDLFDQLTVPTGMDKQKLIDCIMYRGAEFEVLYSDPYFMQRQIAIWANKKKPTFERWLRVMGIEYNPLENYDRIEDWTDSGTKDRTGSQSKTGSEDRNESQVRDGSQDHTFSDSGSHTETFTHLESGSSAEDLQRSENNTGTTSATESTTNANETKVNTTGSKGHDEVKENTVSAYDSSTYQPESRETDSFSEVDNSVTDTKSDGTSTVDGSTLSATSMKGSDQKSTTDERSSSDTRTFNDDKQTSDLLSTSDLLNTSGNTNVNENVDTSENEISSDRHSGRIHGNIGVKTAQSMLTEEWSVALLNIYEEAADMFVSEFCIYVY